MTPESILQRLQSQGVELQAAGDRLRFRPVEAVPPELFAELREHKAELLGLLGDRVADSIGGVDAGSVSAAEVCAMRLSEFATAGLVVEVRSVVLGEVVVFASDNAALDPGERRTVYRAAELRALADLASLDPDGLRRINAVKRTFKGSIRG